MRIDSVAFLMELLCVDLHSTMLFCIFECEIEFLSDEVKELQYSRATKQSCERPQHAGISNKYVKTMFQNLTLSRNLQNILTLA